MTKHQTAVKEKLQAIVTESLGLKIRLLIECELSGKLWIYCDAKDKRTVLKLLRKNRVMNRKRIFAEGYNTKFLNPYPSFEFLEMDKGNKVRRLQRVRKCEVLRGPEKSVYFYDIPDKTIIEGVNFLFDDFEFIRSMVKKNHQDITVNYSGDDLMFYGR